MATTHSSTPSEPPVEAGGHMLQSSLMPSRPEPSTEIVVGAVAEVIATAIRRSAAVAIALAQIAERAAGLAVRVPILGAQLGRLNRSWNQDRAIIEERLQAIASTSMTRMVNVLLDAVDPTSIVIERIDIDRIIEQLDMDRIIERVDVDRIAARLDVDSVLARTDVVGLAREVIQELDVPEMIRESSGTLAAESIEVLRMQGMEADRLVARLIDGLLRRRNGRTGPPAKGSHSASGDQSAG
jgi:hypothetical protein